MLSRAISAAWCGKPTGSSEDSPDHVEKRLQLSVVAYAKQGESEIPTGVSGVASCDSVHAAERAASWHGSRASGIASTFRTYLAGTPVPDDTRSATIGGQAECQRSRHVAAAIEWTFPSVRTSVAATSCELRVELPLPVGNGRFRIIGGGNIYNELLEMAAKLNCSGTVEMAGSVFGDALAVEL